MLSKKKIAAIIIVVLVITSVGVIGAWYSSLVSQKPGLKNIQIYLSDLGESLEIKIITIPKEFSGTASFNISTDEEISYEGSINIGGGSGSTEVPYEYFVAQNGEYIVNAMFENKEATSTYEISYVVENITLTMSPRVDKTTKTRWLDVTIRPDRIPKEAQVKVNISSDEVGFLIPDTYLTASANLYTGSFQYTKRANYTIEASLTNGKVKTNLTSSSTLTAPINTLPIADAGEDQTIQAPHGQYTVTFNASNSDDDSEIALYIWDFGDNVTANTTDPFVQHTYTVRYVMPYTVTLRVQETPFAGEKEGLYSEPDTCVVTFTMI